MAKEIFIVPIVEVIGGFGTPQLIAKYTHAPEVIRAGSIRYSRDTVAVTMIEATQTYLDSVADQPDADFLCSEGELADNIGGQGNVFVRALLESLDIPGNWTSAADSWRETLRSIIGMFLFCQRHEGLNESGFFTDLAAEGFGLNTQWQNLSPAFQDTMQATIDDHGWGITPAATDQVRKLLKDFSEKFEGKQFFISSLEI